MIDPQQVDNSLFDISNNRQQQPAVLELDVSQDEATVEDTSLIHASEIITPKQVQDKRADESNFSHFANQQLNRISKKPSFGLEIEIDADESKDDIPAAPLTNPISKRTQSLFPDVTQSQTALEIQKWK